MRAAESNTVRVCRPVSALNLHLSSSERCAQSITAAAGPAYELPVGGEVVGCEPQPGVIHIHPGGYDQASTG